MADSYRSVKPPVAMMLSKHRNTIRSFKALYLPVFVKVSTGAYERLVFTVPGGNPLKDRKEINRITWASWTR